MILGISLSHDGTLTLLDDDGAVIYAVGEERLNRVKCYTGFPFESLKSIFAQGKFDPKAVKAVAVGSHSEFLPQMASTFAFLLTPAKRYYDLINDKRPDDFFVDDRDWVSVETSAECKAYVVKKLNALLEEVGIVAPISFVNHHLAHAASAYYDSGFDDALAVTMDGEGDYESSTISECFGGKIKRIHVDSAENSIGNLYSAVTKKYGFKIARHEGKITGLAAYGKPEKTFHHFKKFATISPSGEMRVDWIPGMRQSLLTRFNKKFERHDRTLSQSKWTNIVEAAPKGQFADLAAGAQKIIEFIAVEYIRFWLKKTGKRNLVVAGGVFANVKLNQAILGIDEVEKFFVYPNMGDGGLAYGAARYVLANEYGKSRPKRIDHVYYGDAFDEGAIAQELDKLDRSEYEVTMPDQLGAAVAVLLANGDVVGWFQGGMEYGPRALGHRSIIASPVDKNINKWLNDRMHRTEFMPFAPSCLYEAADLLFVIPKEGAKFPAEFMTVTFDMRPEWISKAPAVAHVDGTARPQLVRKDVNPGFHELIEHFNLLTGLPLVINTSFNTHEEPIVCHPVQGVQALLDNMIDVLAIGPYLVTRRFAPGIPAPAVTGK